MVLGWGSSAGGKRSDVGKKVTAVPGDSVEPPPRRILDFLPLSSLPVFFPPSASYEMPPPPRCLTCLEHLTAFNIASKSQRISNRIHRRRTRHVTSARVCARESAGGFNLYLRVLLYIPDTSAPTVMLRRWNNCSSVSNQTGRKSYPCVNGSWSRAKPLVLLPAHANSARRTCARVLASSPPCLSLSASHSIPTPSLPFSLMYLFSGCLKTKKWHHLFSF